jgi:hypothetical protein
VVTAAKLCPGCQRFLPRSTFARCVGRSDGFQYECTECRRRRYEANREAILAANRARQKANPKANAERHRRYRESNREAVRRRARATAAVKYAIKAGRLVRPTWCPKCGSDEHAIHSHDPDYDRPLEVVWLCQRCHMALHAAQRREAA